MIDTYLHVDVDGVINWFVNDAIKYGEHPLYWKGFRTEELLAHLKSSISNLMSTASFIKFSTLEVPNKNQCTFPPVLSTRPLFAPPPLRLFPFSSPTLAKYRTSSRGGLYDAKKAAINKNFV